MTKIEQNNPLNLWLANTTVDTLAGAIDRIEIALGADIDDRSKLASIRQTIEALRARQERASQEDTYEGQVDVLTRE